MTSQKQVDSVQARSRLKHAKEYKDLGYNDEKHARNKRT